MKPLPPHWSAGVALGLLGTLGFSGTPVATRIAVADFSPLGITCWRIVVAGLLGALTLYLTGRTALPDRRHIPGIVILGLGLAVGYPFFLAVALQSVPAAHSAIVTGLTPATTAIIAVLRTGERPGTAFWIACAVGTGGVLYYAYDAGAGQFSAADGWLVLTLLCVGLAYVEGGRVSAQLGGATALCWAMLFLTPFAAVPLLWTLQDADLGSIAPSVWMAMAYLGLVSMFLASILWYRGLALGGIARIGQINLLLPVTTLMWSAIILGEKITNTAIVCAVIVFAAMMVCLKSDAKRIK